ncbi:IS3-like element ISMmy3 family transposase [Mycoplasma mycoides]|uniref:IS3-like element ISMmy3 family transposase n=1 Tax=Mycoplasma mycoides TaxID=2102 RepID=UPI000C7D9E55|nr:IS3-like element ISMmy3 family transposase [Mycoplasma mycoides]QVK06450.1 IS3-like element ISMmy3 family transposase [Mycoplasma mycoides subsp. capri]QVK06552.1 IS3-like element ISMmy3 family transposase [Mycoplasma mycoides subsp. capri]QVK06623.1 IS3-like element ISMmy3 family transposase [Mycoplasma mycoides subsp. capri]QVK06660.1 IS3-like element ISMmy3 family transposase [Mycoplasma mycoides subsp. capri]QVK06694.1 IS3-like element ISMmy3 family transposase [Mycoplasma mycoides subs
MAKYLYEIKKKIINDLVNGKTITQVSREYGININTIVNWKNQYESFGIRGIRKSKNKTIYASEFKIAVIKYKNENNLGFLETAKHFNIKNASTIALWENKYYKHGVAGISKLIGNAGDIDSMPSNKNKSIETEDKTKEQLAHELELAKAEIAYFKKVESSNSFKTKEKVKSILELEQNYPNLKTSNWLEIANIKKSTFYEWKQKLRQNIHNNDKYGEITLKIEEIFYDNDRDFGHKRIHSQLKFLGYKISRKKVLQIMKENGWISIYNACRRRKYSSYKGNVGTIANNVIKRDFKAYKPFSKIFGDLTELKIGEQKLYLQIYKDTFNNQIVGYSYGTRPTVEMTNKALDSFIDKIIPGETIIHTDQGIHYQHGTFVEKLKKAGAIQSMSRKGNCLDNSPAENFFSILKREMFYNRKYKNIDQVIEKLNWYIHWYNNRRISLKLSGLTPVQYTGQATA